MTMTNLNRLNYLEVPIIRTLQFSKSKGLLITLLILLLIGGVYTGIQLLLPNQGLTGYYLYLSETESNADNVPLHPLNVSSSEIHSNLKKKVYEGYPKKTLIKETVEDTPINFEWHSEDKKPYKSPFTIEWDGLLKIQHRHNYTFILGSDDGSELFLNDRLIIDNGGSHGLEEKTETVLLEPGFYRIRLTYFDQGGGAVLYLKWEYSNVVETAIPPSRFYQETTLQDLHTIDTTTPYTLKIEPNDTINKSYIVFRKNDPTLSFDNYGILRTYYVNYWDNHRFEPPTDIPNYNILWRGSVWIPEDGEYIFKVNTNGNQVFLFIDAQPVLKYRTGGNSKAQIHLKKGWKPIQINYFNQAKYATLNLCWQKPGNSKFTNIPSRYLIPFEETGVFGSATGWYAIGFITASLSICLGFLIATRSTIKNRIQEYFAYVTQKWPIVALIFIVILGATLRLDKYSVVPPHGDTMDSYQEAWNGYHILHGEGPKSWEYVYFLPAYKNEDKKFLKWFGDTFMIVKRYIAHPPLFSILAGIPPSISGAKDYLDCRLTAIRLTPIFISTVTIILVFIVSHKIYKSNTASVIAGLLYATVPLIVASGRIAKGDCLLALVLISGVLCVLKYTESKKWIYVIFTGLLAGVSFWCKETGMCVIVILPVLMGRKGFLKEACIAAGIGIFLAACYLLYNYLINPEAFFKILSLRGEHQGTVFNIALNYIKESRLALSYASFGIGYLLWFWFAVVYVMGKRDQVVPITTFIFLMTLCALSKDGQTFGWFLMPIYPFMAIAGGLFLRDFISKPNTGRALLLLLVLMAVPLKGVLPEELFKSAWLFRWYLAIGTLPFLAFDFYKHRITATVAKVACYTYIFLFILINVYIVYHLPDLYDPMKR
ncbi:MAG: phospholipid carrier-dependent glycosyltransferase [Planctomycetes bacterium]|nr:phospholipid carrier-dependent glycosyltransferase [Planctomycetota bacterium]